MCFTGYGESPIVANIFAEPLKIAPMKTRRCPIACGQTISQPSIVALMTEALDVQPRSKVLEIGTGSGYQAAILSQLARRVYTVDRHSRLVKAARRVF